jgi:hypothetical protein
MIFTKLAFLQLHNFEHKLERLNVYVSMNGLYIVNNKLSFRFKFGQGTPKSSVGCDKT